MLKKLSLGIALIVLNGIATVQTQAATATYPNAACRLSPQQFSSWFLSEKATKNGVVSFADSVDFPTQNTVCDFYKWAHQMFLWITSPIDGGILLDSPVFYDVNFNAQGGVFIQNTANAPNNSFALRGAKPQSIQAGGQAGGNDTLLSLNGSLVYFGVHANDVYAWFDTAVENGILPSSAPFPTTQTELDAIVAYAKNNNVVLADAKALTMELKTAWVDAATVPNKADYVTIQANVPNYVGKVGDSSWTISTSQPNIDKTLALVGMHVVGPVQGHPEMVWATFEHNNNAPNNTYYYTDNKGKTKKMPYNSKGKWSFMTNGGSQTGALVPQMKVDSNTGNINATPGNTIKPNNVYRAMPWGGAPDKSSASNNGQLISLNRDVGTLLGKLQDVRKNYFQVGAVWTQNGSIPTKPDDRALQKGSTLLANATMETYHQIDKKGCFGCHFASSSTGTSHIFPVQPLIKK